MTESLYTYILDHTPESPARQMCRQQTAEVQGSHMQISPEQGAFLALMVKLMSATLVIEVGTFTGYSSLAMAEALPPHGRLIACDVDEKTMAIAREFWIQGGVADQVRTGRGKIEREREREGEGEGERRGRRRRGGGGAC